MPNLSDINNRLDIINLIDNFYTRVQEDELLQPVFKDVDWPHHLPIMYNFWSSMILGDQSYQGNPMQKHLPLAIGAPHFKRWLELFTQTVDDHFEGFNATEIKNRAQSIAAIFQHKMGLMK